MIGNSISQAGTGVGNSVGLLFSGLIHGFSEIISGIFGMGRVNNNVMTYNNPIGYCLFESNLFIETQYKFHYYFEFVSGCNHQTLEQIPTRTQSNEWLSCIGSCSKNKNLMLKYIFEKCYESFYVLTCFFLNFKIVSR